LFKGTLISVLRAICSARVIIAVPTRQRVRTVVGCRAANSVVRLALEWWPKRWNLVSFR
jgi:hypothetical protein